MMKTLTIWTNDIFQVMVMEHSKMKSAIESILFVSGDPVPLVELRRVFQVTELELNGILTELAEDYQKGQRGIQLFLTEESAQMTSNPANASYVCELLQPTQTKSFSQAMMETLSVVAYRQPVTRADIEAVRGVRCEYAVSQLLKQGLIQDVGRKDTVGRPVLFATTDKFLHVFGLHTISELPRFQEQQSEDADGQISNLLESL